MNYKESMDYMNLVSQYGSVLGLENTKELLRRLDNPQDKLRFVHVAGTNGKGSVCTYIAEILSCAGYRVGRYVSPTIFEYRERIQVIEKKKEMSKQSNFNEMEWTSNLLTKNKDQKTVYISEENVAKHLTTIKEVIEGMIKDGLSHPTPFEIETAMAFLEFVETECQIVVLEVGMGGRLDATNVITTTDCAVLTSISMDHMSFLGNTLEEIAGEKAGIIKEGIKVVSYAQEMKAEKVIEVKAKKERAELIFADFSKISQIEYSLLGTYFVYESSRIGKIELRTPLLGENQPKNAVTAIEAVLSLKELGYEVTNEHIKEGIAHAKWRGRFDIVNTNPLVIVDGAHNYDAALSLRKSMELYLKDKKVFAIVGIFADKEYDKVFSVTLDKAEEVFAIEPNNKRALSSAVLAECAHKYCDKVTDAKGLQKALKLAMQTAAKEDVIICFGSLSFLHEIYAYFEEERLL